VFAQAECHLQPRQGTTRDKGTQARLHTGQALHAAHLTMHMQSRARPYQVRGTRVHQVPAKTKQAQITNDRGQSNAQRMQPTHMHQGNGTSAWQTHNMHAGQPAQPRLKPPAECLEHREVCPLAPINSITATGTHTSTVRVHHNKKIEPLTRASAVVDLLSSCSMSFSASANGTSSRNRVTEVVWSLMLADVSRCKQQQKTSVMQDAPWLAFPCYNHWPFYAFAKGTAGMQAMRLSSADSEVDYCTRYTCGMGAKNKTGRV
jgi:predicted secreted protein